MSRGQTLRALVKERLAAAAEDIFVLFERTITQYEEELCHFKNENKSNFQIPSNPGPGLNQEITETPWIKEEPDEQNIKLEEEQLPVSFPESSAVYVKTKESSQLLQRQTEHREETQEESISSKPQFYSETEEHTEHSSDTDCDGEREPFSSSAAKSTGLFPKYKSAPETTVDSEDMLEPDGAERKQHQSSVCNKRFGTKLILNTHLKVHTDEKPYSCTVCKQNFIRYGSLEKHKRTHTGEKPYSCTFCEKKFSKKFYLKSHMRIHTGEKPYSCTVCEQTFTQRSNLDVHLRIHTGEKPYSCSICEKAFAYPGALTAHKRTHTGEKPYNCSVCGQAFAHKCNLNAHKRKHTGEKPYSCPICEKDFSQKGNLDVHLRTHTGEKPYSCSLCDKAFTQISNLIVHQRKHTRK